MKKIFNRLLLLFVIGIAVVPGLAVRDVVEGQVVSGAVSYPNLPQVVDVINYDFELSMQEKILPYLDNHYPSFTAEIRSEEEVTRIIPVDARNSGSTLNLLERFILTKHGVAPLESQNTIDISGNSIEQIAYALHSHHDVKYYEVFSALKVGNKGWIFVTNLEVNTSENITNIFKSSKLQSYNKIIKNFKIKTNSLKDRNELRLKENNEINQDFINEGKIINKKFRSTF